MIVKKIKFKKHKKVVENPHRNSQADKNIFQGMDFVLGLQKKKWLEHIFKDLKLCFKYEQEQEQ